MRDVGDAVGHAADGVLEQVAYGAAVAEVLVAPPMQLGQAEQQLGPCLGSQLVMILRTQEREDPGQLQRRVVVEVQHAVESRRQAGVALEQVAHFVRIAGEDHDEPVPVVFGTLQQRLHRFVAVRIVASSTTRL